MALTGSSISNGIGMNSDSCLNVQMPNMAIRKGDVAAWDIIPFDPTNPNEIPTMLISFVCSVPPAAVMYDVDAVILQKNAKIINLKFNSGTATNALFTPAPPTSALSANPSTVTTMCGATATAGAPTTIAATDTTLGLATLITNADPTYQSDLESVGIVSYSLGPADATSDATWNDSTVGTTAKNFVYFSSLEYGKNAASGSGKSASKIFIAPKGSNTNLGGLVSLAVPLAIKAPSTATVPFTANGSNITKGVFSCVNNQDFLDVKPSLFSRIITRVSVTIMEPGERSE